MIIKAQLPYVGVSIEMCEAHQPKFTENPNLKEIILVKCCSVGIVFAFLCLYLVALKTDYYIYFHWLFVKKQQQINKNLSSSLYNVHLK